MATAVSETLGASFERLASSPNGLSSVEAGARAGHGNTEGHRGHHTVTAEFLTAVLNPLTVVLLSAAVAAALVGQVGDAALIVGIVTLSTSLNFWQTFRSHRAVHGLQRSIAPTALVLRDGVAERVQREQIVVGDVVLLSAGALVPADARVVESRDLHVQQSALTGESLPVEKHAIDGVPESLEAESPAFVYLGTSVVSGTATAVVFATGRETAFGDIVERLASRPAETEFERGTARFGMLILETVVFLVFFILVVNIALGRNAMESLLFSVALAVGLTPGFLPMISTVTLAQGAIQMAREKVIVKHLPAIQNLGSIDILCSDKTGTLTAGTMSLDAALDGFGNPSARPLLFGHLNSQFESGIDSPLDAAILERPVAGVDGFEKADELPFDFERRRVSVVVTKLDQALLITKGAPEGVMDACSKIERDGRAEILEADQRERCLETFRSLSRRGYRVLAVATKPVPQDADFSAADERELTLVGFLTFADHLLDGVTETLVKLRADGVNVKILTGDNELVTRHLCAQVGIDAHDLVLGPELERLDAAALAQVAESRQVFARVSPAQKHRIIGALKGRGHVVGFMGDGINDAPSLHAADVGISVAGAADVAREASDIVLLERRLDVLHRGILAGRRSFGNVLKYLLMGTSSNFGNMFSMAAAAIFLPFLPMLPTQILLNNFLYDAAQLTIPSDSVEPAYIERPQRWDVGLIRNFMLLIGPISSAYDFLTFFVLLKVFHFGERAFHTGWFLESLATQTLVLFVIRTVGKPWSRRPSWPLTVTTLGVVALAMSLPFSGLAVTLGFEPLPLRYFSFLFIVTASYLLLVQAVKERAMRHLLTGFQPEARSGPRTVPRKSFT
jgi:Mg2+-importing ATPase